MASPKRKPAADEADRLPNGFAVAAESIRRDSQALVQIQARAGRITARDFNRLRDIEDRIAILGRAVALGGADRNMVVDRIRGALVRADLDAEARR
jgi:hypothetical protein